MSPPAQGHLNLIEVAVACPGPVECSDGAVAVLQKGLKAGVVKRRFGLPLRP